jgi:hypothetical protein
LAVSGDDPFTTGLDNNFDVESMVLPSNREPNWVSVAGRCWAVPAIGVREEKTLDSVLTRAKVTVTREDEFPSEK